MKLLITGICGFVGSALAHQLHQELREPHTIFGFDNLSRSGSELNRAVLRQLGIQVTHGDLRQPSDLEGLPAADWVIDAAAHPSVLAGVDGRISSRQIMEHNLAGTLNLIEYCARHRAGLILLSTSRVYSIAALSALKLTAPDRAFEPDLSGPAVSGLSREGIAEDFPTAPPLSLYGASKLASEIVALEYGEAFHFPVWVNRCGVLAGAGQFGTSAQGIFAFWIRAWRQRAPLKYLGFSGHGYQVRDCLHPADLATLVLQQLNAGDPVVRPRVVNVAGGRANRLSLAQLSEWCRQRFGEHTVGCEPQERTFDVPWLVLDSRLAGQLWDWRPQRTIESILEEIADHAEKNPHWLQLSSAG
jgi:CDP-paratose 2-epimerase